MQGNADAHVWSASRAALVSLSALILAVAAFAFLAPAASAKSIDRFIGGPSGSGIGSFNTPRGIAINGAGTGGAAAGDVYVVEHTNHRVQVFDAAGNFKRMWGKGVRTGAPAPEICTAAQSLCAAGQAGTGGGEFNSPQGIAIDQDTGNVYVADRNNRRIQQFDALGNFIRTWGYGVATGASTFEICTANCLIGIGGAGLGQIGATTTNGTMDLDVSSPDGNPATGNVYFADSQNRRVNVYNLDGTAPSTFGSATNFGTTQPRTIAVDSRGIVYASDSNGSGEIDRYDSAGANGAVGFIPSITGVTLGGAGNSLGLKVDPDSDGAGSDEDVLYVLRDPSSGNTTIRQFGPVNDPGLSVAPTAIDASHMATEFGSLSANGFGVDGGSGDLYVTASSGSAGHGYYVLDDDGTDTPGDPAISSPADVTATSATLKGIAEPANGLIRYHFEYTADGTQWTSTPQTRLEGTGSQPVSAAVTGLTPGGLYRVRLSQTKVLGPNNTVASTSAETLVITAASAPTVETRPVSQHDDTSAWLVADVNPNNQSTTYRFEWGLTQAYGRTQPLPDAQAGSGGVTRAVMQKLTGLQPNTTYHYRVVATNDTGVSKGADQTFVTRPPFAGFAERAYEQASPVDKNGGKLKAPLGRASGGTLGLVDYGTAAAIAPDGSSVVFASWDAFADAEWGPGSAISVGTPGLLYQARRNVDGSGWTTRTTIPRSPAVVNIGNPAASLEAFPTMYGGEADTVSAFYSFFSMTSSDPDPALGGAYRVNTDRTGLTPLYNASGRSPNASGVVAASSDMEHLVIRSNVLLTDDPGAPASVHKVYEWVDGGLRLVSIDPDGNPFTANAAPGRGVAGVLGSGSEAEFGNPVSEDGSKIFFSTPMGGNEQRIYLRSNGTTTTLVSPSQATVPDPMGPRAKRFAAATPSGSHVFFLSSEELTDDANTGPSRTGTDLYRYEPATDTLIDISADADDPNGAEVRGLLGASDDGKWVYYAAKGQVVPGKGIPGRAKIYLWHDDGSEDGQTRYVGTLAADAPGSANPNDGANFGLDSPFSDPRRHTARVTPDGQSLVFQSTASVTGYPNEGFAQVYVYEADANGGAGQLSCVSCRADGSPATGHGSVPYSGAPSEAGRALTRFVSDDGSRVFFHSEEDLLPTDVNGRQDVYEWTEGHLRLVSSGKHSEDSYLWGASRSGDDVFFMTRAQLVGQDEDDLLDIYDARIGGGIAQQNAPPPGEPCVGEACKAGPEPQPAAATPQSTSVSGPGNVTSGPGRRACRKGKVRRRGTCVKSKKAKRSKQRKRRGGRK